MVKKPLWSDNLIKYQDKEYSYDYLNRLTQVKQNNNTIAPPYYYNALNRRVQKELDNKTITYIYHKNRVIQEYETINNSQILTNTYVYRQGIDNVLAYTYNNNTYHYVKDRLGSITALANTNGSVIESYSYNSFSKITIKDQDGRDILQSQFNNSYTYTGRRLDSESNLYYYRNRMYDANLGRFLSKDPLGYIDGLNLYAYVMNNPLKYVDPMETQSEEKGKQGSDGSGSDEGEEKSSENTGGTGNDAIQGGSGTDSLSGKEVGKDPVKNSDNRGNYEVTPIHEVPGEIKTLGTMEKIVGNISGWFSSISENFANNGTQTHQNRLTTKFIGVVTTTVTGGV